MFPACRAWTSGTSSSTPLKWWSGPLQCVAALVQVVDVVFLEVPSYLSVHHGEGLTPLADAVLVVGERRTTTVGDVKRTKAALKRLGAPVVGLALTRSGEKDYVWGHVSEFDDEFDDELATNLTKTWTRSRARRIRQRSSSPPTSPGPPVSSLQGRSTTGPPATTHRRRPE